MITLGVAVYCYVLYTLRQLKMPSREPVVEEMADTVAQTRHWRFLRAPPPP